MVQLAALALQPSTFDPMRATLAGASLLGSQIQNAAALQDLRMAPERNALALEAARRQSALAQLQLTTAQNRQATLDAFRSRGGMGSPAALSALSGEPELFSGALSGYSAYQNWQNVERARAGQRVLAAGPEGSDARNAAWQQELGRAVQNGLLTPEQQAQMAAQPPTDLRLQGIIDLARPITNEPSINDILRMPVSEAPAATAPVASPSAAPPGGHDMGSTYLGYGLRNMFGLNPPADVAQNAAAIGQAQQRVQDLMPPDNGTRVRGWLSSEAQAAEPAGAPGMPGVTLSPADTAIPTPSWALGETPAAAPSAAAPGSRNIGDIIRSMTPENRAAAMLLLAKKDWAELSKMINNSSVQEQTATAQARGKAAGDAQAALPQALQSGASMINNIDNIIADPNLGWVTGVQADWSTGSAFNPLTHLGNIPAYISNIPNIGSNPTLNTTRERIAQVTGQAFLQAFQSLRGAGQISEQEGAKAQAALTRLGNLAQDDAGYMRALLDARREIWDLTNLARTRAGQPTVPYVPHPTERPAAASAAPDAEGWITLPGGVRMREVK